MIHVTKLFVRPETAGLLTKHYEIYNKLAQSLLSLAQLASMVPICTSFAFILNAHIENALASYGLSDVDPSTCIDFHKASQLSHRVEASISPGKNGHHLNVHILFFRKESKDMHYEIMLELDLSKQAPVITNAGFCGHGAEMAS